MKYLVLLFLFLAGCPEGAAQCDKNYSVDSETFQKFALAPPTRPLNWFKGPTALQCGYAEQWGSPAQIAFDIFGVRRLPESAQAILSSVESITFIIPFDRHNEEHWARKRAEGTLQDHIYVFFGHPEYIRYFPGGSLFYGRKKVEAINLLKTCPFYLLPFEMRSGGIITHGFQHLVRIESEAGVLDVGIDFTRSSIRFAIGDEFLCGGVIPPDAVNSWEKLINSSLNKKWSP